MNGIEALDWGAYAHFRFTGQQFPAVRDFVSDLYLKAVMIGGPGLLFLAAITIFLIQGRRRAALIVVLSAFAAGALTWATHCLVPRRPPPDAQNWVGPIRHESYPSDDVLWYTLGAFLLVMALWSYAPRWWQRSVLVSAATMVVVCVCLCQLFLCLNFVTDLIGGITGGALIGLIASRFMADPAESKIDSSAAILANGDR